jgi:hypothetical protein
MEDVCCPVFDPRPWNNKILTWHNKRFIKTKINTFFYMPIGFGNAMAKLQTQADKYNARIEHLCLSKSTSMWNMEILLEVDKEIPNIENILLSGTYYSKVYKGPYSDTGKWMTDFSKLTKEKGYEVKETYMWYTTCPKCAKKQGRNHTVIIARI